MKCDVDIRKELCGSVVLSVDHVPADLIAHDEGTDGVGSIHDEDHGGCSTRVKAHSMDWRVHLVSRLCFFFL